MTTQSINNHTSKLITYAETKANESKIWFKRRLTPSGDKKNYLVINQSASLSRNYQMTEEQAYKHECSD